MLFSVKYYIWFIFLFNFNEITGLDFKTTTLIDTRFPSLITRFASNVQTRSSCFGVSVALIPQPNVNADSPTGWVLIGEPRGNYSGSNFVEPGVLWKCSIQMNNANLENCQRLPNVIPEIQNPTANEAILWKYKGAWLGGTMKATKRTFVTCAHRLSNITYTDIFGACYWTTISDLIHDRSNFTSIAPSTSSVFPSFGASVLQTDNDEIFVGAPGTGIIYHRNNNNLMEKILAQSQNGSAYFGYALTSGKYFSDTKYDQYCVAGSPRGKALKGQVKVFPCLKSKRNEISQQINGKLLGSYFGSVLFSVDIDDDGRDELLIGAPFGCNVNPTTNGVNSCDYSRQRQDGGHSGCVYIFKTEKVKGVEELVCQQTLIGNDDASSKYGGFGSSIGSFGDIKGDGSKVIIIGAPYEDNGAGAVYLYNSKELRVKSHYEKRISGKEIFPNISLKGFGFSLSEAKDIDGNETPDMAIGTFSAQGHVVILRTRRFIDFETSINITLYSNSSTVTHVMEDDRNLTLRTTEEKQQFMLTINSVIPRKYAQQWRHHDSLKIYSRLLVDYDNKRYRIVGTQTQGVNIERNETGIIEYWQKYNLADTSNRTVIFTAHLIKNFSEIESDVVKPINVTFELWYNDTTQMKPFTRTYSASDINVQNPGVEDKFFPALPAPASSKTTKIVYWQGDPKDPKGPIELDAPIWIYVVAAAVSFLLLSLIILGLYSVGFFKRDLKEKLHSLKSSNTNNEKELDMENVASGEKNEQESL